MKITRLFPKLNLNNLHLKPLNNIKNDLRNNILISHKSDEIKTYNEILSFINYIEKIKIIRDNKDKIDYP
jgi:hypothetical protein